MADDVDAWGLPIWGAPERNKGPLVEQLEVVLAGRGGTLLEIAAATGQHAIHFASALRNFIYQTSDYDEAHLATLQARAQRCGIENLRPPVRIDVTEEIWPISRADVIYCANMIHIAPWEATLGLFRGAARLLSPGGLLLTYGPYAREGRHTSESNERFDESLRARDPSWGVRDMAELTRVAGPLGLTLREPISMPANNFLLVWDRIS